MFEKDEDYRKARKESKDRITKVIKGWSAEEETVHDEGFVNGAEFGYNKANEWHKQEVDDIYDLISEDWSVRYFICIMKDKSRVTAIGNCDEGNNGEVSVNLFFEHDDEKYYIDDIVWWKEIVLPEQKESE